MANERTCAGGISGVTALQLLFIGLKLTGHIEWSWWWVMAPTWLPISLFLSITFVCVVMAALTGQLGKR